MTYSSFFKIYRILSLFKKNIEILITLFDDHFSERVYKWSELVFLTNFKHGRSKDLLPLFLLNSNFLIQKYFKLFDKKFYL